MITLPPLPFAETALAPHMSADTLATHHGKHHKAYVDKTNELIAGSWLEAVDLDQIIGAAKRDNNSTLFNQSAQVWNHNFLWQSLSPSGGGHPGGALGSAVDRAFGGYDVFRQEWTAAATSAFGSGWCWLIASGDGVAIKTTHDADTPLASGQQALLTLDLWEHAYYLDWKNERPEYVAAFLDHLVNWDFAATNFAAERVQEAA